MFEKFEDENFIIISFEYIRKESNGFSIKFEKKTTKDEVICSFYEKYDNIFHLHIYSNTTNKKVLDKIKEIKNYIIKDIFNGKEFRLKKILYNYKLESSYRIFSRKELDSYDLTRELLINIISSLNFLLIIFLIIDLLLLNKTVKVSMILVSFLIVNVFIFITNKYYQKKITTCNNNYRKIEKEIGGLFYG